MHPVLFKIGPVALYSYGLMIAAGFLAASALAARRARSLGLDPGRVQGVALAALLGGLIGGRAAFVALHWDLYRANPLEILRLDHGGLVFFGGFAGGLLSAGWAMRRARLPFPATADLLVPPLVLAHALGRIGCFLNGCCYGKPTSLPWGLVFPPETLPRHPTQLYESAFLLALFFALKALERRSPRTGTVLLSYGLAYGVWRFFIEFLRGDNPVVALGLTVFQWIALPLALGCGMMLVLSSSRKRGSDFKADSRFRGNDRAG